MADDGPAMVQRPFDALYLETDGKVFLLQRDGRLVLPRSAAEAPCPFEVFDVIRLQGRAVALAHPRLAAHPHHWYDKDDVPGLDEAEPLVRLAINRTLLRTIANVAAIREGKVLLVQGSRGLTKDLWHFPGGFVSMGEDPADAVVRELQEELGAKLHPLHLVGTYQFQSPLGYHIRGSFFVAHLKEGELRPDPGEVAAIRWVDTDEAQRRLLHRFDEEELAVLMSVATSPPPRG